MYYIELTKQSSGDVFIGLILTAIRERYVYNKSDSFDIVTYAFMKY